MYNEAIFNTGRFKYELMQGEKQEHSAIPVPPQDAGFSVQLEKLNKAQLEGNG